MYHRRYGENGPTVILLHGGPAVPGFMAPVGRRLGRDFRVLEPWQRDRDPERLTVARHVTDLRDFITEHATDAKPALVGSSWGAMLALAHAAEHPDNVGPIVMIGSGTFDRASRKRMHELIEERMTPDIKAEVAHIKRDVADPDERLQQTGQAILPIYAHDPVTTDLEIDHADAKAHLETWSDMIRLQESGTYPAAFTAITSPVLMLHGDVDPHPGSMIRDTLLPVIPHLEYHEFPNCGHYPWIERVASDAFYELLINWLNNQLC